MTVPSPRRKAPKDSGGIAERAMRVRSAELAMPVLRASFTREEAAAALARSRRHRALPER